MTTPISIEMLAKRQTIIDMLDQAIALGRELNRVLQCQTLLLEESYGLKKAA